MTTKPFYHDIIPGDWTTPEVGSVFSFLRTFSFSREQLTNEKTELSTLCIHYGDIHAKFDNEILDLNAERAIPFVLDGLICKGEIDNEDFPKLRDGDLIIADASEDYEGIAESVELTNVGEHIVVSGLHTFAARDEQKQTAIGFRTYLLRHPQFVRQMRRIATGFSVYGISKTNFAKIKIAMPSIDEQKAIATVLGIMDVAVNKNNQLIAKKELQKKYLMQVLLTGKKRMSGFSGEWQLRKLGDVTSESIARNNGVMRSESLMAVTKSSGILPMRKRVQGISFDRCKVIEQDSFAYNPMRVNIGSIARWRGPKKAMVSGDYVVFRCDETKLHPNYLDFVRQANLWTSFIKRAGDGSVRVRIYFSHLKHLRLKLPPLEEQKAISGVLRTADKEIDLLKAKTAKLKEQKKWLMQVLLTGKKRLVTKKAGRG